MESHNVLAKLTGAERPQETITYGAHWDAYGVGAPDAQGRTIRPGADDVGTGVAGELEIAGAMAKGPKLDRTVVSMAKRGVPTLLLMELVGGPDLVNGGRAAGDACVARYTAERYHKPGDVWSPDWNLRGAAEDVALLYDTGRRLANSDAWPSWNAGSEFATVRALTAGERR